MNPQVAIAVLQFVWDRFSAKPKSSRGKKPKGGGGVGMFTLLATAIAAGGYFGIGPDKLRAMVFGTAHDALGKLEQKVTDATGKPGPAAAAAGPIRVYFTAPVGNPADPNDIAHALAGYIDAAKSTLDVAGFEIDNKLIVDTLVQAAGRGVRVRVVTDTDYMDEYGPVQFAAHGIPVVDDKRSALMHNKFVVFDGTAVWTGSMNFTENCAYKNNNNGVYLAVPEVAANYATKFKWMFEDKVFGRKPTRDAKIPNPLVRLHDNTVLETLFSTHDDCASNMIGVVAGCGKTLDFLAFSFTHPGIGRAAADRVTDGIQVRGVFEKSQTAGGYSQYGKLKSLGLPVYVDANPRNMHHKVMVVDGKTTVTGSFNFSESAAKSNDENMLILRNNPAVATQFTDEFQKIYESAKAAAGAAP
ncbi:MAG: phospholipase D-like domain-containing protein [Fimbriiglobus sp.]